MKLIGLYLMALLYTAAGVYHFINPVLYKSIIPPWLPYPLALIYLSGAVEVAAGILLLFPTTRIGGAWLTIVLLVGVFPANIQMAVNFYKAAHPYFWLTIARLPLQGLLIWWAWLYTRP